MPFQLTIFPGEASAVGRIQEYIDTYSPIVTLEEDGRVNIGFIDFETLEAKPLQLENIESIETFIDTTLQEKPSHAVCIHFEQSTGTPLLVLVQVDDVEKLTALLNSGFGFLPGIGYA